MRRSRCGEINLNSGLVLGHSGHKLTTGAARAEALAHDAFEPKFARVPEDDIARFGDVLIELQPSRCVCQQAGQFGLAHLALRISDPQKGMADVAVPTVGQPIEKRGLLRRHDATLLAVGTDL
jgi:hypothetical protein